jgi:hypothetical protein
MRRSTLSTLMTRASTSSPTLMIFDLGHMIFAELGDVDETVDVTFEFDEGSEAGDLGDLALHDIADLEAGVDDRPWVGIELLHAEADALIGLVDAEHGGFDFLALLEHFGRMVDLACPTEVGDVDHAVDAFFQFHKGTVSGEVADRAGDLSAHWVADVDVIPRIGVELADAEADLALVFVDAKDDGVDSPDPR